jgi:hypothetical protein
MRTRPSAINHAELIEAANAGRVKAIIEEDE